MEFTTKKSLTDDMAFTPYGTAVLIGNWAERRFAVEEQSNAILPGIRVEGCERHQSLSQDTYTDAAFVRVETVPNFLEQRKLAYRNYLKNSRSGLKFVDHESLKRNFTTTQTLDFQELPRQSLKLAKGEEGCPPKQAAEIDRLKAFGNLTKTHNYLWRFKCEKLLEELRSKQTTYSASYNRPWRSKSVDEYGTDYDGDMPC
ncbi:uncharacterized protein [Drosophila kikkawai]|uniref:Cilia- and flagella-associated protein 299 n=1 Tax=Drosophila kikkawai TaxID=30033 RepID=A0A6P4JIV8_DROKI|nr:uncharacterized protein LOC108083311 [Drosophila kikkawai]KAH8341580.1 hypothetical protein KR059_010465 [Drosophila kikkawai]